MQPLYQRLRELDWDTFQKLAYQLVSAKYPGLEIHHVEGAGGDRGLDCFEGQLKGHPTIWQCKQFANGLGPKQRPQVKESLRAALKHFKPMQWILVLSIDLDRKGQEWFQKLQRAYEKKTKIGLFQASDIVRELIYRRAIRDTFFPGAVVDSIVVARALKGLDEFTSDKLDQLAKQPLGELIAQLEEADARFSYQIVYGPDVGADLAQTPPTSPLLVASVLDQNKRIDVFARDLKAMALDPPSIRFAVKNAGLEKFQEFLRTGKRQEFDADEVSHFASTFDFLLSGKQIDSWKLVLQPSPSLSQRVVPLRVTFSSSSKQVRYDLIQFRVSSAGTEQFEIESISRLPFVVCLTVPLVAGREGDFTVRKQFEGADVRDVAKAVRAISLLRAGGNVELYALEIEKTLGDLIVTTETAGKHEKWEDLIMDAARVSEIFKVDLRVPKRITKSDLISLTILIAIVEGKPVPLDGINAKLVKSAKHEQAISSTVGKTLQVFIRLPKLDPPLKLFGSAVDTGPISLTTAEALIENDQDFIDRYNKARYGEGVPLRICLKDPIAELGGTGAPGIFFKPAGT